MIRALPGSWHTCRALACAMALSGAVLGCAGGSDGVAPDKEHDAARINLQLGVGYLQQGNLAVAKEKLERSLAEDPSDPEIHGALALFDERLGNSKEADKEFRKALRLAPDDPSMLNNYAVYLCSHERADEGVRVFEQAASNPLYRTPWAAYTNAGVCLRAAHRDADAMQRFNRALQSNPSYAEAVFQASTLDLEARRYAEARRRIDIYLLTNPATPDLLLLGWRCAGSQGDTAAQAAYGGRLSKDFPNSDQAHALAASRVDPG